MIWQPSLAALQAAIMPSNIPDAIIKRFSTSTSPRDLTDFSLNGVVGGGFRFADVITVTTSISPTPTYDTTRPITIRGVDFLGAPASDTVLLTKRLGGETVATEARFAQVTEIVILGQSDANGFFQFGTLNAPTPFVTNKAQGLIDALSAAGGEYDSKVKSLGGAAFFETPPSQVFPGVGVQIFTGRDLCGVEVQAYSPIPVQPDTGPVTANDVFRACRYVALSAGLLSPPWRTTGPTTGFSDPAFGPPGPGCDPFALDVPTSDDVNAQINGTWPFVAAFVQAQSAVPLAASNFLAETLQPLIEAGRRWAQYLRDFPVVTWTDSPPVQNFAPPEPLASMDPVLLAVQLAVANATAFFGYIETI